MMRQLLESLVLEGLAEGCYPSACAAVGCGDEVLAEVCVGEAPLPGDTPVDRHTRYDMASVSKVIGPTMIALQALEQGQLRLEETISDFFDAPEDKRSITIRQLMTHTAGFVPSFRLDQAGIAPEEVMDCILRHPLEGVPGEHPAYSCMGFILLAKMLEQRLGKPLDQLAQEMVMNPLGLQETGYCPTDGTFAATEINPATGKPFVGVVHDENARFLGGVSGNAGIFMSLYDAERFCMMLARMGAPLMGREVMALALHNDTPGEDEHRGLGFHLSGTPLNFMGGMPLGSFGHTGFTGTSIAVEPQTGFWVILLSNRVCPTRENRKLFPLRRKLHTECWRAFQG